LNGVLDLLFIMLCLDGTSFFDVGLDDWYIGMFSVIGVMLACLFCVCLCYDDRKRRYFVRWEEEMAEKRRAYVIPTVMPTYASFTQHLKLGSRFILAL
jgi:hypothetical protein